MHFTNNKQTSNSLTTFNKVRKIIINVAQFTRTSIELHFNPFLVPPFRVFILAVQQQTEPGYWSTGQA